MTLGSASTATLGEPGVLETSKGKAPRQPLQAVAANRAAGTKARLDPTEEKASNRNRETKFDAAIFASEELENDLFGWLDDELAKMLAGG